MDVVLEGGGDVVNWVVGSGGEGEASGNHFFLTNKTLLVLLPHKVLLVALLRSVLLKMCAGAWLVLCTLFVAGVLRVTAAMCELGNSAV